MTVCARLIKFSHQSVSFEIRFDSVSVSPLAERIASKMLSFKTRISRYRPIILLAVIDMAWKSYFRERKTRNNHDLCCRRVTTSKCTQASSTHLLKCRLCIMQKCITTTWQRQVSEIRALCTYRVKYKQVRIFLVANSAVLGIRLMTNIATIAYHLMTTLIFSLSVSLSLSLLVCIRTHRMEPNELFVLLALKLAALLM